MVLSYLRTLLPAPIAPFLTWPALLAGGVLYLALRRLLSYSKELAMISHLPGLRYPFSAMSIPGALLPTSSLNPGRKSLWEGRYTLYRNRKLEIISELGYLGGEPMLMSNSPEVAKQILGSKSAFDKPQMIIDSLAPFGPNVFSTNNAAWPRHRRIVQPGFSSSLYAAVWSETINTYYDCLATERWEKEGSFVMPNVIAVTSKFALYLIAKCGFGIDLSWNESVGQKVRGMTMPECFEITSTSVVLLSMLPPWMFKLPLEPLRKLRTASQALEVILQGIIDQRRSEGSTEADSRGKNIFSLLLKANEEEKGSKASLSDRELVSNVFLLLLAGHETTSRSLAATLGLLAANPKVQQRAYDEIRSVVPRGSDPTFEDYDRLPFVQGCFLEGLRMFPSSPAMIRAPTEDTVLSVPTLEDPASTIPVPVKAGQYVWADFIGIGYNPRIYPSPEQFLPERWADPATQPLLNFSYGPRVRIGRRFALTEAVGLLCLLLRDYEIEPVLKEGEAREEWQKKWETRVDSNVGFGPTAFPLKMTRRSA